MRAGNLELRSFACVEGGCFLLKVVGFVFRRSDFACRWI